MNKINILVTLDRDYIKPLQTMLTSLFENNRGEEFDIYVVHSDIGQDSIATLKNYSHIHNSRIIEIKVSGEAFSDAPTTSRYTKAMYYRLLAHKLLPETLNRILYLDPDILVINRIRPLYETDLKGNLYAAAIHTDLTGLVSDFNRARLKTKESEGYFNSGVLLMDLELQRNCVNEQEIYHYIKNNSDRILPDQDTVNALYGTRILPLDDSLYNYDVRHAEWYKADSAPYKDMDWVMENTVILHFCGKNKPWNKTYINRFGSLYKHYMSASDRAFRDLKPTCMQQQYSGYIWSA